MVYFLWNFVHAGLVFVAPLKLFNIKTTILQKVIFTLFYGVGVILSRNIYTLSDAIPFGTHTILLIILNVLLLKIIIKDLSWLKSLNIVLLVVVVLLINDALIVGPFFRYFDITTTQLQKSDSLSLLLRPIVDSGLIIMYIIALVKNRIKKK